MIMIQLTDNPVSETNWVRAKEKPDAKVRNTSPEERKALLELLGKRDGLSVSDDAFMISSKKEYFRKRFEAFHSRAERILQYELEDFVRGKDVQLYLLNKEYEDRDDVSVYTEENTLIPLDKFVRQTPEGRKLYVGGVITTINEGLPQ